MSTEKVTPKPRVSRAPLSDRDWILKNLLEPAEALAVPGSDPYGAGPVSPEISLLQRRHADWIRAELLPRYA